MAKCEYHFQHGMRFRCYGTKEMEECTCGGDTRRCDFYPEKRSVRAALRPCPFCKVEMENKWPTVSMIREGRWVVTHYCDHPLGDMGVTINVYGSSMEEAVNRWNNQRGVPNG